jgi:hypothetical protein
MKFHVVNVAIIVADLQRIRAVERNDATVDLLILRCVRRGLRRRCKRQGECCARHHKRDDQSLEHAPIVAADV